MAERRLATIETDEINRADWILAQDFARATTRRKAAAAERLHQAVLDAVQLSRLGAHLPSSLASARVRRMPEGTAISRVSIQRIATSEESIAYLRRTSSCSEQVLLILKQF